MLAQAAPAAPAPTGAQSLMNSPIPMMFLVGIIFYFILIRPQQKRAKEQKKLIEALASGDKVITSSGMIGEVITVKDRTVTLRCGDAKLEVTKESVVAITEPKS